MQILKFFDRQLSHDMLMELLLIFYLPINGQINEYDIVQKGVSSSGYSYVLEGDSIIFLSYSKFLKKSSNSGISQLILAKLNIKTGRVNPLKITESKSIFVQDMEIDSSHIYILYHYFNKSRLFILDRKDYSQIKEIKFSNYISDVFINDDKIILFEYPNCSLIELDKFTFSEQKKVVWNCSKYLLVSSFEMFTGLVVYQDHTYHTLSTKIDSNFNNFISYSRSNLKGEVIDCRNIPLRDSIIYNIGWVNDSILFCISGQKVYKDLKISTLNLNTNPASVKVQRSYEDYFHQKIIKIRAGQVFYKYPHSNIVNMNVANFNELEFDITNNLDLVQPWVVRTENLKIVFGFLNHGQLGWDLVYKTIPN